MREKIISKFSPDLHEKYLAQRLKTLSRSAVEAQGQAGKSTIVAGCLVFVEDKNQFTGFILLVVPVIILLPIFDQFDVYEVIDAPELQYPRTLIATTRETKRLHSSYMRFGGMLKDLYFEDQTGKDHGLFLEALYYT